MKRVRKGHFPGSRRHSTADFSTDFNITVYEADVQMGEPMDELLIEMMLKGH